MTQAETMQMISAAPDTILECSYHYGEVWAGGAANAHGVPVDYDRCEALRAVYASGYASGINGWSAEGRWSENNRTRDDSGRGDLDGQDRSHGQPYNEGGYADVDTMRFASWI